MRNLRPGYLAGYQTFKPRYNRSFGYVPLPLDQLTRACFPGYKEATAHRISEIENALKEVSQTEDLSISGEVNSIRSAIEDHMNQHAATGGCGFTHPADIEYGEQLVQRAKNIAAKSKEVASQASQPKNIEAQQSLIAQPEALEQKSVAEPAGPTEEQMAELKRLEKEAQEVDAIVTHGPLLAPPGAYTGSALPTHIPKIVSKTATDEQKVSDLIEAHRAKQSVRPAITRASVKVVEKPMVQPPKFDILSWIKGAIFGSSNGFSGLPSRPNLIFPATLVIIYLLYRSSK